MKQISTDFKLNHKYKSKVNTTAHGCVYEIVKKNKTTCWVKLWENNLPTTIIYKNVKYNILGEI